jgi:hypothetical protein
MDELDRQAAFDPEESDPARLDDRILLVVREASADLWRHARGRAGTRALLCLLIAPTVASGLLRLAGDGGGPSPLAWTAWGLLALAALGVGGALALLDGFERLVVQGPILGRLGRLLRLPEAALGVGSLRRQLGLFASPQALSRSTRLLDLPLILFLARCVLGVDAGRLLKLAQAGVGREGVVAELERMARSRAAGSLRRARRAAWSLLIGAAVLTGLALAFTR